ncbi:MAG: YkgJ family cysteine cluster protein, partial [bacterium]|nr:YkgJ family cysteine cluster protein [bacterium]
RAGLRFKCTGCGDCCTGAPGYVWVTNQEIAEMAGELGIETEEFLKRFVRLVGIRKSLVELTNGDCIFFDNQSRTLSYDATPPAGTTGTQTFSGTLSIDGSGEAICGDSQLDPATFHPADMSDNWLMEIDEVTAYGAAWKTGATWPRPPNPIPIDYVTNAGFLWKLGEVYHFDPAQDPPWVPGAAFPPARGSSLLSGAVSSAE